ncbi:hypothetical protein XELAEV_18006906mg [Xenopus laevis]|uniref:Uncharacterized protein n=1 Tax=Xenopus laevis TaxID=8355 RepID=A0A974I474_XENLA|nr:hypothetical protein XELAEV_18006906mg [Xenopus laevis]
MPECSEAKGIGLEHKRKHNYLNVFHVLQQEISSVIINVLPVQEKL